MQFRTYDGNVIPYQVADFTAAISAAREVGRGIRFPIVEVGVGPTVNADLNRLSVTRLLERLGPEVAHVVVGSSIPLRWL
jgi:hypothetical protein